MKKYAVLALMFLTCVNITLQGQAVKGTVYDTKFDKPVSLANVQLSGSGLGAVADESGRFSIEQVNPGNYLMKVTLMGYQPWEKEIEVGQGGLSGISVYLQPLNISLNNEFVITARRLKTDDFSSPEAITLLNSQSLSEEAPRTAPEALQGATGVFVQKTNHGGGSPFIRGLTGNQNLLMIDGIRLNNATYRYGPNQYLNSIDPLIIGRLEVVRGSGSVLYGSDAMGGVVNVITQQPDYSAKGWKTGGRINAKFMTGDMQKTGRGELHLANEKITFTGGFTYSDFGDIIGGDTTGKQTPTGYQEYSADLKLKMKLSGQNEITFAYQYDKQSDVPRYDKIIKNYTKYHFDPQIRQLGYIRLKSDYSNKWFKQILYTGSFNQSDETRILQKTGSAKISKEHDLVNTIGTSIEVSSVPTKNWRFVSGIEYYFDKVNSETTDIENGASTIKRGYYPDGASSGSFAIFTSHTIDIQKFSFVLGGRFNTYKIKADDPSFEDVDVSPSALVGSSSIIFHTNENFNLICSVYSAFRAPNLNDLSSFGSFNAGIEVPNPNLKPEKSISGEFGFKARFEKFSSSVFVYQSWIKDLISRVEASYNGQDSIDGEKVFTKSNFDKSSIHGVEAEFQYAITEQFSMYGNINYTFGENKTDNEPVSRIPPLNGKLGIYYRTGMGFWGKIEWQAASMQDRLSSGDISDSRIPDGGTPGWQLLNLRAGYILNRIQLTAGLNNILNEDYRTHGSGINGFGRSAWLAISIGF
ncbi:MAG: TonB-dependent receptor [Bacteroidales bacterium]|nr:TonB-dependent receptor [Bacteroidales bacterium]